MTLPKIINAGCGAGFCLVFLCACATPSQPNLDPRLRADVVHSDTQPAEATGKSLTLPEDPTLSDYLRYAALNHPVLEAAFHRWKAALEEIPQMRGLPDPRFNYGYFIEQVETRVGPQRQKFGIAQTFPWFGKLRLRADRASNAAVRAQLDYEQAKLRLFYNVKDAYYELAYLSRAIQLTEENIELIKHLESVAQARFRAGSDAAGVVKAQVELGKLDDQASTLRALRIPINARLCAALNRSPKDLLPWPHDIPQSEVELDDHLVLGTLLESNVELAGWDAKIREAEQSRALARKAFYPDLTVGLDYVETEDARSLGLAGNGRDPVMIMGSFNLPLWWGKYRAGLREAEANLRATTKDREHRENLLLVDAQMALFRIREAERKISLFNDTLTPLAKNSLDVAEQAYQAGRADFLQLIDAQRLLLDIQLSYQRAIIDRAQRIAEIEMIVGRTLDRVSTPSKINE